MCMACQEMDLYYAYLDALEDAKRKAQPWQCEVTLIPEGDAAEPVAAATKVAAPAEAAGKSAVRTTAKSAVKSAKPGFACDEPE